MWKKYEEFELEVCPGSVQLFPSDKAVSVSDLDYVGFEVKNLIVLDGIWNQPKAGYLSTIESIVFALKAVGIGENKKGLDNLLDTFECVVDDQRRCKDERLSKVFPS
ncbi:hypothetical protein A2U01_0012385 [Trifolium medium]|uniref:Uncharacterized protein n=1 Tax=Trifolium medium TaxID=97028 RepID=A0A392MXP2_9FABA|nr:hypothetical protein [Trifolium medium]